MGFEDRSASGCELLAEVASRFGEVRFCATGASMMPAVWPGDVLTVRQGVVADLLPGQIVLYRRQEKLVAHRVVRLQGDLVITRGDSVRNEDSPIRQAEVIGPVVSVVRRGRSVPSGQSFWGRAGSHILQRSSICLRAAMFVARLLWQSENEEISWA